MLILPSEKASAILALTIEVTVWPSDDIYQIFIMPSGRSWGIKNRDWGIYRERNDKLWLKSYVHWCPVKEERNMICEKYPLAGQLFSVSSTFDEGSFESRLG